MSFFANLKPNVRDAINRWEKDSDPSLMKNELNISTENFKQDCFNSLNIIDRRIKICSLECENEIDCFLKIIPYDSTLNINWPNWHKTVNQIIKSLLHTAKKLPFKNKMLTSLNISEREYFRTIREAYEVAHNYDINLYSSLENAKDIISRLAKIINHKLNCIYDFLTSFQDAIRTPEN